MLKTVVKKGNYHDSVVLMLLTNHISTIEGVNKASIMMATPANKDIFKQSGLDTAELMEASANDMVIVADIVEESVLDTILSETEEFFGNILDYLNINNDTLQSLSEDEIIEKIKVNFNYNKKYDHDLTKFLEDARVTYDVSNGIIQRDKNEFLELLLKIYDYFIKNIKNKNIDDTFYSPRLDQNYLDKYVPIIGSPIIYYVNERKTKVIDGAPENFLDDFGYLYGALHLFVNAYYYEVKECPFYKGTICNFRQNTDCLINCFRNYNKPGYENCLLTNSLKCTGLKK